MISFTLRSALMALSLVLPGMVAHAQDAQTNEPQAEKFQAPMSSVSIQEVLREVYLTNPSIRAARAELRAVHELLPQAQAGFKPTATASGNVTSAEIESDGIGTRDGTTKD
ncbi:MAG TPA: hypothetical protein PLO23_04940, partial [Alphaproteobacteria bacterium]|nr:hypothetical protein [Alphaproteobacteria bacterium]